MTIFVKFFKVNQEFFIKIDIKIMLITLTKQTILFNNFNFNENFLICFKKLNENNQIVVIFEKK